MRGAVAPGHQAGRRQPRVDIVASAAITGQGPRSGPLHRAPQVALPGDPEIQRGRVGGVESAPRREDPRQTRGGLTKP
jgi:hypothetical protein